MNKKIAIINYGMGNLHSAQKALEHVAPDRQVIITADPDTILAADHIVFPGVGAIRDCMGEIHRLGLDQVVLEAAANKPFLGICVGMQSLMRHSEENGGVDCLNIFNGDVKRFPDRQQNNQEQPLKVPHMGWNQVHQLQPKHPLWQQIPDQVRFYFVHSYYVTNTETAVISGAADYGLRFAATLARDNVFAVQFHPEKSHQCGLQLLKNFVYWDGQA